MDELKWMYAYISREEFQEKIAFAEKLLEKYGAEYVIDFEERAFWTLKDGTHAYENIQKRIYKLGNEFIRVDWVCFTQKPFIVLEFSDKIDGPYEDADPFPYDLPDDEFEFEIRFSLGLECDAAKGNAQNLIYSCELEKISEEMYRYYYGSKKNHSAWVTIKCSEKGEWYYIRLNNVSQSEKFSTLQDCIDNAYRDMVRAKL